MDTLRWAFVEIISFNFVNMRFKLVLYFSLLKISVYESQLVTFSFFHLSGNFCTGL